MRRFILFFRGRRCHRFWGYHRVVALLCLAGLAAAFHPVRGATYEVGPGKPYTELQDVVPILLPGDLVLVDGDAEYPGDVTFTEPGTAGQPITIRGVRINGQRPVISGGTNTVSFITPWPYSGPGADHYIFEGFDVTQGSFRGIYHQADDLIIRDTRVHDCPAHGVLGADLGSGSLLMEYVEIHDCGNGGSQHQVYMATDETNRPGSIFRMQFCYIHDGNGGNNVKSRAQRNEIYYNWIEGGYYHELEMIGPEEHDPGLFREDSDVVGNVFWKRNTFYVVRVGGDGTGETNGRYRFVNNTFICGSSAAFRLFDGLESIEMHNNVFTRDGAADLNIMRTVDAVWASGEQISGQNNWVLQGAINIPAAWIGTISGPDPGFTDIGGNDLTPAGASPLLNSGTMVPGGPPGFEFPDPLFPPGFHPPKHSAALPGGGKVRPVDSQLDIGAYERLTIWYVDDDNQTGTETGDEQYPFSAIQSAVDAASPGDAVWVAGGDYSENICLTDTQLFLSGGFPGGTPGAYAGGSGGDFSASDPELYPSLIQAAGTASAVLLLYTGTSGSRIEGFVVQGGLHGIELDDDLTWPLITGVTISGNTIESCGVTGSAGHRGGGIFLTGSGHTVSDNIIRENSSGRGAGLFVNGESIQILNNQIRDNISYDDHAGGIYLAGTSVVSGNTVSGNRTGEGLGYGWGGGALVLGTSYFSGNTFSFNHAPSIGGGVFVDEGGWAELRNDQIFGNTTAAHDKGGAGVYVDGGAGPSHAELINCTVADNTAPGSTGGNGVYVEGMSSAVVTNSIFWGNSGDDFYVAADSGLSVTYSLSQETISGTGNLHLDPRFADGSGNDYHLMSITGRWDPAGAVWVTDSEHSPGIDTGDPAADYSRESPPNGSRINMGAFGNTDQASRSHTGPAVPCLRFPGILLILCFLGIQLGRRI